MYKIFSRCLRKTSDWFAIVSRFILLVYDEIKMKEIGLRPLLG